MTDGDEIDDGDNFLKLALSIGGNGDIQDLLDVQNVNHQNQYNPISPDKIADVFSIPQPPNASDPEKASSLLASQLAGLSVKDREKAYMDLHGISEEDSIVETPELINNSLMHLNEEIVLLPDKKAYDIAEQLDSDYVHNKGFLMSFLRCERFDCPKAALRIVRHFQMKLDMFGKEKLVLDITQDDLDMEAMDALYSAGGRFLNAYDSAGRTISLVHALPKVYNTLGVLRKGFYNITVAFRDEERQKRGTVTVCTAFRRIEQSSGDNKELNWKYPKLNEGSPMRISAIHVLFTDEAAKDRIALMSTGFNKDVQVRTRIFQGATASECLEQLRGHGIDPASIPIDENGELNDVMEDRRRLEAQRQYERLNFPPRTTIYVPFCLDVILGKGKPFQTHPGNKRLRDLVDMNAKRYEKAAKGEKKAIAQEIIDTIHQSGGYFLKQDGQQWMPIDNEVARVKVSATFRTQRWIAKS